MFGFPSGLSPSTPSKTMYVVANHTAYTINSPHNTTYVRMVGMVLDFTLPKTSKVLIRYSVFTIKGATRGIRCTVYDNGIEAHAATTMSSCTTLATNTNGVLCWGAVVTLKAGVHHLELMQAASGDTSTVTIYDRTFSAIVID